MRCGGEFEAKNRILMTIFLLYFLAFVWTYLILEVVVRSFED